MLLVFEEYEKKARTKQAINTIDEEKAKKWLISPIIISSILG